MIWKIQLIPVDSQRRDSLAVLWHHGCSVMNHPFRSFALEINLEGLVCDDDKVNQTKRHQRGRGYARRFDFDDSVDAEDAELG